MAIIEQVKLAALAVFDVSQTFVISATIWKIAVPNQIFDAKSAL
jgi:hypothetical protein